MVDHEPTFGFAHAPDGRSIADGWAGSGSPLVMVPGWLSHVTSLWSHPAAASAFRHLVLYATLARGSDLANDELREALVALVRSGWSTAAQLLASTLLPGASTTGSEIHRDSPLVSFTPPTSPCISPIEENDMPVDDRTRLNLHRKLEAVLGHNDADTLMAHLPPVTWSEVATKGDLAALGTNLRTELRADFVEAMNRQIKWLIAFAAAWTTVLVTLVRLVP